MIRLLQFLAFLLLIRYVWRAVQRLLGEVDTKRVDGDSKGGESVVYGGRMIRDPVCGVHIPERSAVTEHRGDRVFHFCSDGCREIFRRGKAQAS